MAKIGKANVQAKFGVVRKDLNATLIERQEEIDLILIALLCKQHVLLVGEPGTAKSLTINSVARWLGEKTLTIHMSKDTSRAVAFGPTKLSALKNDRIERNLEGGAADTKFLIMEEVFKSGPAVLDMFLLLMNERVMKEGIVECASPLWTILGTSNEWSPDGCETALAAFFDRFLLRKTVSCVRSEEGIERLLAIPTSPKMNRSHEPDFTQEMSMAELEQASAEASAIQFTHQTKEAMLEIRQDLAKEGIKPGDRRMYQAVSAVQANAYLNGSNLATTEHLDVLQHIWWTVPEHADKVASVILKKAAPSNMIITRLLKEALESYRKVLPHEVAQKLEAIQKELETLPASLNRKDAIEYIISMREENYKRIIGRK